MYIDEFLENGNASIGNIRDKKHMSMLPYRNVRDKQEQYNLCNHKNKNPMQQEKGAHDKDFKIIRLFKAI